MKPSLPQRVKNAAARAGRDLSLNMVVGSMAFPRGLRWRALRTLGLDVDYSTINGSVFFGGKDVSIGRDAFINYGVFIDGAAPVRIGDRCSLGPRVLILTGSHQIGDESRRAGAQEALPVVIGDSAWIGANATILPGCTIGAGAIVAAGAVVTQDVPEHHLVAGVPARVVKSLLPADAQTS